MYHQLNKRGIEYRLIYLSIILSSFIGAQIFGISLNKIALIPLEIYLMIKCHGIGKTNNTQKILLIWYCLSVMSAISGLIFFRNFSGVISKLLLFFIQAIFIYMPLLTFSYKLHEPFNVARKAIILMAKVNAIWAFIQFGLWYSFKIDINTVIFSDIFRGIFGTSWSVWNFEAGTLALRVSGFQNDAAFFAILIVLGFCMTDEKIWRYIFIFVIVLSMSRTGIVAIFFIVLADVLKKIIDKNLNLRNLYWGIATTILIIIIAVCTYVKIPSINYQVNYFLLRLSNVSLSRADSGTFRHLTYFALAIVVWLFDLNIVEKFLGVGVRIGGVAFSTSEYAMQQIVLDTKTAWAIECDYAELLLGRGICGYLIYYVLIRLFKEKRELRKVILAIIIIGLMYNVIDTTLVQILIIFITVKPKLWSVIENV